jgi:hypothetical protein
MRFEDRLTARRIGVVTGQEWIAEPPEVDLPDALIDLAVASHYDLVEPDEWGFVAGWWVPDDEAELAWHTPTDELVPGDCGVSSPG